ESTYQIAKGKSKQGSIVQPKEGSKFQAKNGKFQPICASRMFLEIIRLSGGLWENNELKAFPIFPSGVQYMPKKIRDNATIFQKRNRPQTRHVNQMTCFPNQGNMLFFLQ
ncbi:hypothetical protein DVH24_001802, partial [Malus domestica]